MIGKVERELMQKIKNAFDPRGILNPGKASDARDRNRRV